MARLNKCEGRDGEILYLSDKELATAHKHGLDVTVVNPDFILPDTAEISGKEKVTSVKPS